MNNAGIANFYGFEWGKENDESVFKDVIDVNLLGPIRTIKVFLPLLRKTRNSRIINVGSKAGKVALKGLGIYSVSKFGVRGLSDFLRTELKPYQVHVSIIEPYLYATQMGEFNSLNESAQALWRQTPQKLRDDLTETNLKSLLGILFTLCMTANPNIHQVSNAMVHGVTSFRPKSCYPVSSLKRALLFYLLESLPMEVRDVLFSDAIINRLAKL